MEKPVADHSINRLTERQRDVLFLVCKGFHNTEIAAHMGLSSRLVKECVHELLLIYDVSNRTELAGLLAQENSVFSEHQK